MFYFIIMNNKYLEKRKHVRVNLAHRISKLQVLNACNVIWLLNIDKMHNGWTC